MGKIYNKKEDQLKRLQAFFRLVLAGIFIVSFPHLVMKNYFTLKNSDEDGLADARERYAAFEWLEDNSLPSDIILSEWTEGNDIVAVANRRVVVSSKVYPSEAREVASRYMDLSRFFFSASQSEAAEILKKYQVEWIFINKKFDDFLCNYTGRCLWQETLISDILSNKKNSLIRRAYESKNTLIYKVIKETDKNKNELVYLAAGNFDEKLIKSGFNIKTQNEKSKATGLIVPHHYPQANYLLAESLDRIEAPEEVVILGPEHNASGAAVKTALGVWETSFGPIFSGEGVIESIAKEDNILIDNEAHLNEWSINTLLPYIKYAFPKAKVVPVLINDNVSAEQIRNLSDKLASEVKAGTLFILSTDFVHELSQEEADRADAESIREIAALKGEKIDNLFLDARGGLKLFLMIMDKAGIKSAQLVRHSNNRQEEKKYPEFRAYPYLVTYQTWIFKK